MTKRRRSKVPASQDEPELSFREWWAELRRQPRHEQLRTIGALVLVLPFLALVFLVAFFLLGGWAVFDGRLPAWAERLFTFLLIVFLAWALLRPIIGRLKRGRHSAIK